MHFAPQLARPHSLIQGLDVHTSNHPSSAQSAPRAGEEDNVLAFLWEAVLSELTNLHDIVRTPVGERF